MIKESFNLKTKTIRYVVRTLAVLLIGCSVAQAGEQADAGDEKSSRKIERGADGLPLYKHHYANGLYSTVTAMNTYPKLDVKGQKKIKLKVPGFKKDFPAYVVIQPTKAPLVVVFLGMDGKVDGPWGDLFPYWYSEYGYHVLTFDTPFTPLYPELTGGGVVGNFDAESEQMAAIINAFIKSPEAGGNVTSVGVMGMSFGASHALLLGAKAKAGKLPFELSGCLALSPPVKLQTAALTLDRFFREDRWDTTMIDLAKKFASHMPVNEGVAIPFKDTEMRAAIGFVFRDGLSKVVERNDRVYRLKVLPNENSLSNRNTHAEGTGFERYMHLFVQPYWQKQGKVQSVEELWAMPDLEKLLPQLPDYAEVVMTANDPFNDPVELAAAQAADRTGRIVLLPNGGHLGYIASEWMLVKSLRIFNGRGHDIVAEPPVVPEAPPVFKDDKKKKK